MSVGVRPAAHNNRIWRASQSPYRARRSVVSICRCASRGMPTKVHLGLAGAPRYTAVR